MEPADTFWAAALRREQDKVNAASGALGGLEYLTGPDFDGAPGTRLRRIREVVEELRVGLGMPAPPELDATHETSSTPGGEAA